MLLNFTFSINISKNTTLSIETKIKLRKKLCVKFIMTRSWLTSKNSKLVWDLVYCNVFATFFAQGYNFNEEMNFIFQKKTIFICVFHKSKIASRYIIHWQKFIKVVILRIKVIYSYHSSYDVHRSLMTTILIEL